MSVEHTGARVLDEDLAAFADDPREKTPAVGRVEAFLEVVEPGWAAEFTRLYEGRGDVLQRYADLAPELPAGESAYDRHLLGLASRHPEVLDVQILVRLLGPDVFDGYRSLVPRFAGEPKLWSWVARHGFALERVEAAHRCIGLDGRYPRCRELYREAVAAFNGRGCSSDTIAADLAINLVRDGLPAEPVLGRGELDGIWRERSRLGLEIAVAALADSGRHKLEAATAAGRGAALVLEIAGDEIWRAVIAEPIKKARFLDLGQHADIERLCERSEVRVLPPALAP